MARNEGQRIYALSKYLSTRFLTRNHPLEAYLLATIAAKQGVEDQPGAFCTFEV